MADDHGYRLVLPFDTDDAAFVRGFEVGFLYGQLPGDQRTFVVHTSNAEMVLRLAEALGLSVVSTELDDHFMEVTFGA